MEGLATAPATPRRSVMERIGAWAETASDRVNPLIVKEVRQGLRTRVFWIVFGMLLLACLVISMVAYATIQGGSSYERSGQWFFFAYFVPLGFTYFFVLPYNAFRSLLKERDDETWVLLTLTGLGPRRILRGKLGSAAVQAALYGSAVLPFLVLSYDLNGIDLLAICSVVVLAWVFHLFLSACAISVATFGESRLVRGLVSFAVLGTLLFAGLWGGIGTAFALIEGGLGVLSGSNFWLATGVSVWAMLSTAVLLFEIGASRLSLPTENYTLGPRLALLVQLAGSVALTVIAWAFSHRDAELAVVILGMLGLYLTVAGVFLATDLDGQAPRLRRARGPLRLFTPGAVRGFRLFVAMLAGLSLTLAVVIKLSPGTARPFGELALIAAPGYALLYVSAPVLISRALSRIGMGTAVAGRALAVLILIAGTGLPPLLGEMSLLGGSSRWLNTFNPIVGLSNLASRSTGSDVKRVAALWIVAALVWLLTDAVLAKRDSEAQARGR